MSSHRGRAGGSNRELLPGSLTSLLRLFSPRCDSGCSRGGKNRRPIESVQASSRPALRMTDRRWSAADARHAPGGCSLSVRGERSSERAFTPPFTLIVTNQAVPTNYTTKRNLSISTVVPSLLQPAIARKQSSEGVAGNAGSPRALKGQYTSRKWYRVRLLGSLRPNGDEVTDARATSRCFRVQARGRPDELLAACP